jgi:hypothetical protein
MAKIRIPNGRFLFANAVGELDVTIVKMPPAYDEMETLSDGLTFWQPCFVRAAVRLLAVTKNRALPAVLYARAIAIRSTGPSTVTVPLFLIVLTPEKDSGTRKVLTPEKALAPEKC